MLPWTWRDAGLVFIWTLLGILVAAVFAVVALAGTGGLADPTELEAAPSIGLFALISAVVYGVIIWAVYHQTVRKYGSSWASLGINRFEQSWIWWLPALLIVQLLAAGAVNLLIIAPLMGGEFENPQIEMITGGQMPSASDFVSLLLVVAILAPIAEELFFRGMLYPLIRQRLSMWSAILLNAALFSVVHFIPVLLPALFVVGIMLAWVRERSGSVIPSMILHFLQNSLAVISIYVMMSQ